MTEEQIIGAAGICKTGNCKGCPYHELYTASCINKLMEDVFDLIDRQKAEIERYKGVIKILENDVANAKYEAIKEFEERLKEKLNNLEYHENSDRKTVTKAKLYHVVNWIMHEVVPDEIDNLIKEMTEGK